MTVLRVRDLTVAIDSHPVLESVSLSVEAGEIVALTGESGSGKSMTALSAMGLLPRGAALEGEVVVAGLDVAAASERELCSMRGRMAGMVFQEPMTALNPVRSIGAQVEEVVEIHRSGADRANARDIAREALDRAGLPPDRIPPTRFPHELSGGQRQRVCIAMAIALRPRLLIADEPTTALDVTTQARILRLLRDIARDEGAGLLLIAHDLAAVAEVADRIAVMREGQVAESGPTEAVLGSPSHPHTRELLAAARHRVSLPPAPIPSGRPLLRVENAARRYPPPPRTGLGSRKREGVVALDGVGFEMARGERLGLVGESGSGKSTLARAILGLERLQGGRILLDGGDVAAPAPGRRTLVQAVFQDPYGSFNPRHRVARLVAEPFHNVPDPPRGAERDARVRDALASVGLDPEVAGRFIHEFSGGQRQRIAIARALVARPELVLFDEPVSALDMSVRAQILDLVADLCRETGLAYLFVSHDLGVVREVTDRVLVMKSGRIVEEGATREVFAEPGHPYTRELVAASPRLPDFAGGTGAPETG